MNKDNSLLSDKLLLSPEWVKGSFGRLIKMEFLRAIQLQPDKEDLVLSLFRSSVSSLRELLKNPKKLITYTRASLQKNNLMIWNDKLLTYKAGQPTQDLNTMLLKILARELISKEEACKPFWTNAYRELSETLPSPIVIDCPDSDLTSSSRSSKKQAEHLQSLKITEINHPNKSLPKISSASSISIAVDKWVNDRTQENKKQITKTLSLTFHPTEEQKVMLDRSLRISNYVYNKTVNVINGSRGQKFSKLDLRDKLVTANTRKGCELFCKVSQAKARIEKLVKELARSKNFKMVVKAVMIKRKYLSFVKCWYRHVKSQTPPMANASLKLFEESVHKDIRANAVFECFTNYMNCIEAIKAGRIRFFKLKYRSRAKQKWSMGLTKKIIKLENGNIRFTDSKLSDKTIRFANRTRKVLRSVQEIKDCKITKVNGVYTLRLPVVIDISEVIDYKKVVGIDPGVSTFLSMYTPDKSVFIKQTDKPKRIDRLRKRIKWLRKNKQRKRIRRSLLNKLDDLQKNVIDELHWKSINYLVKNYNLIFSEHFQTQGFVKGGKSKCLNRDTNNLKPYLFRQRLQYKALSLGKIVSVVDAHNTTKTCSSCGAIKHMKLSDRIYRCSPCNQAFDRDVNASKNILLKGLLS